MTVVAHPDPWRQSSLHKPRLRGWLHTVLAPVSVAAGVVLVVSARSTATGLAAAAFSLTVVVMFVTSAVFHRRWFADAGWHQMRRLDQTAIWLLIGGTYTGVLAVAPDGDVRVVPLAVFWCGIGVGIAVRWLPVRLPVGVQTGLFLGLSWFAGLDLLRSADELGDTVLGLVLGGGVLYTAGAVILGLRRPDPWPRSFGYHEIWHVMVAVAVGLHAGAVGVVVS